MPYATGLTSAYFFNRTMQAFYGIIVIVTTVCNWFLHKELDKPNKDNRELLEATAGYRKLLIPDIAIRAYPCRYGISSDHDVHCADCGGIHSDFEGCFRPKEKDIG